MSADPGYLSDTEDVESSVLMSVLPSGKKLGIACYDELTNVIFADTIDTTEEDMETILSSIKLTFKPTLFLLPPSIMSNKELLDLLLSGIDGTPDLYMFKAMKSSSFNAEAGLNIMCSKLYVRDLGHLHFNQNRSIQECHLRLSAFIDLENVLLKQVMCSLLQYLQTTVFSMESDIMQFTAVRSIVLNQYMRVDAGTLDALQVFKQDRHPNVIKGSGRSKEGFSLFALLDRTSSTPGKLRLRDWMLRPFCDKSLIIDRQNGIAVMVRAMNRDWVGQITRLMKRVHDIPRLLLRIKKVTAKPHEWLRIFHSLESGLPIIDMLESFSRDLSREDCDRAYISELLGLCTTQVARQVYAALQRTVDFPASIECGLVSIRPGYDATLDRLRDTFDGLEAVLTTAAQDVLECAPLLSQVSVEYVPQIGYLVAVSTTEQSLLPPGDFRFIYQQGDSSFFKHDVVLDLDDCIGDVKADILDTQKALVVELEELMLEAEAHLQQLSIVLSTLDAIMSLGEIAREMDFVRPEIVDENVIAIKAGRHLLQALSVDQFVPNDTFITAEKNTAIITGPNGSGKSVYLKQIGVLVYLAHVGSWLPCEQARIGLTDRIYSRISSVETVSSPQSAFALDLAQMARMLSGHTDRSLCLIDEFGKGTAPLDGIALVAATITHFTNKPAKAVFVMHFTEVLHNNVLSADTLARVLTFQMEVLQSSRSNIEDEQCDNDDDSGMETTPLYKLQLGVCTSSEGIACAKLAGVPDAVLHRAASLRAAMSKGLGCTTSAPPLVWSSCAGSRQLLSHFLKTPDWSRADTDALKTLRILSNGAGRH